MAAAPRRGVSSTTMKKRRSSSVPSCDRRRGRVRTRNGKMRIGCGSRNVVAATRNVWVGQCSAKTEVGVHARHVGVGGVGSGSGVGSGISATHTEAATQHRVLLRNRGGTCSCRVYGGGGGGERYDFSGEGLPMDVMESLTPEELADADEKIDEFMRDCGEAEGEVGVGVLLERRRPPPAEQTEDILALAESVRAKVGRIREGQDMTVGEIRLTIGIDSAEEREEREDLDSDDPRSVSPDEQVVALMEVMDEKPISDELALRVLAKNFDEWPEPELKPAPSAEGDGIGGQEKKELKDTILGWLPLYAVSAVPIFIGVGVVAILFANSLT